MSDLGRLTHGLAVVKHGLNELDTSIRSELTACNQLSQQIANRTKQNQDLKGQVADVSGELCVREDECEDLAAILQCCHEQVELARARKQQLMAEVVQLKDQVHKLVTAAEEDSDRFCAAYASPNLEQQEAAYEQQERDAEASLQMKLQQLRSDRRQVLQQQKLLQELQQKVLDNKVAIQDMKVQIAAEAQISSDLLSQLDSAQRSGPAARQLAWLQRDVAEREAELLDHQYNIAAQEVELEAAKTTVQQLREDAARKRAELTMLNRTIQALGLPPVMTSSEPTAATPAGASDDFRVSAASAATAANCLPTHPTSTSRGPHTAASNQELPTQGKGGGKTPAALADVQWQPQQQPQPQPQRQMQPLHHARQVPSTNQPPPLHGQQSHSHNQCIVQEPDEVVIPDLQQQPGAHQHSESAVNVSQSKLTGNGSKRAGSGRRLLVSRTVVTQTLHTIGASAAAVANIAVGAGDAMAGPSALQQRVVLQEVEEQQQNSSSSSRSSMAQLVHSKHAMLLGSSSHTRTPGTSGDFAHRQHHQHHAQQLQQYQQHHEQQRQYQQHPSNAAHSRDAAHQAVLGHSDQVQMPKAQGAVALSATLENAFCCQSDRSDIEPPVSNQCGQQQHQQQPSAVQAHSHHCHTGLLPGTTADPTITPVGHPAHPGQQDIPSWQRAYVMPGRELRQQQLQQHYGETAERPVWSAGGQPAGRGPGAPAGHHGAHQGQPHSRFANHPQHQGSHPHRPGAPGGVRCASLCPATGGVGATLSPQTSKEHQGPQLKIQELNSAGDACSTMPARQLMPCQGWTGSGSAVPPHVQKEQHHLYPDSRQGQNSRKGSRSRQPAKAAHSRKSAPSNTAAAAGTAVGRAASRPADAGVGGPASQSKKKQKKSSARSALLDARLKTADDEDDDGFGAANDW